jgi:hypothetical protein
VLQDLEGKKEKMQTEMYGINCRHLSGPHIPHSRLSMEFLKSPISDFSFLVVGGIEPHC